jgi:hypothetical protein
MSKDNDDDFNKRALEGMVIELTDIEEEIKSLKAQLKSFASRVYGSYPDGNPQKPQG